jgi:hypothetical protein
MTIRESLKAIAGFPLDENNVTLVLLNNDLNPDDTYTKDKNDAVEIAAAHALYNAYSSPNVSEGGYSINIDREALRLKILALSNKHVIQSILDSINPQPTISSPSIW